MALGGMKEAEVRRGPLFQRKCTYRSVTFLCLQFSTPSFHVLEQSWESLSQDRVRKSLSLEPPLEHIMK